MKIGKYGYYRALGMWKVEDIGAWVEAGARHVNPAPKVIQSAINAYLKKRKRSHSSLIDRKEVVQALRELKTEP